MGMGCERPAVKARSESFFENSGGRRVQLV
jgi:hypothetical protein